MADATYRDAHGELAASFENDGLTLVLIIDGTRFEGQDFDGLEPVGKAPARFTLNHNELCGCELRCTLPVGLLDPDGVAQASELGMTLTLGHPAPNGGIDREDLTLTPDEASWFEDELVSLRDQLPPGWRLRCCFGCAWSDYSPIGHGLFGSLACFRRQKPGYRAAADKPAWFALFEAPTTEWVQETHLCDEFEPRPPNTGYRG